MRNTLRHTIFTALFCLFTLLASPSFAGDTLQRVVDFKTLKVGMSADQPPLSVMNKHGELMGLDVDIARALAGAMQVKLEIKAMPFPKLMEALKSQEIDMIISGMSITPARSEHASFIGPYMMSGKSLLTKKSTLEAIESGDSVNRSDLKLVALKNSTSESFASEQAPDAQLTTVSNYEKAVAMVISGEADAMVADMPACVLAVARHGGEDLTTLREPLTVEPIGIAVSKDDLQFLNLVQNYVAAYTQTGVLNKLRTKWLQEKDWIELLPQ